MSHSTDALPAPEEPVAKKRAWLVFLALSLALALALVGRTLRPKARLPVLAALPTFSMQRETGAAFSDQDLRGSVWVADFIFTHCTSTCPRLTSRMAKLQGMLKLTEASKGKALPVRLVSFSVDPENDTPDVLKAYSAKAGADPSRWAFITGTTEVVHKTVVQGFKVSTARVENDAGDYDIMHGNWFVVGDKRGQIRGYFSVESEGDLDRIIADVLRLEQEGP